MVVARFPGHRGGQGVRAHGEAAELNHSDRGAANFGSRRVQNEAPSLELAEALVEQVNPNADADDADRDRMGGAGGANQQSGDYPLGEKHGGSIRWGLVVDAPRIKASGGAPGRAAEKAWVGLRW